MVASAQKSFKFDRVNLLSGKQKEFVFPAQLEPIGATDTYKFEGTNNTINMLPERMNLGKGNGINTQSDPAKYTMEVYYTMKPKFSKGFEEQKAKYDGDPQAGVCIRTEYAVGVACKIKDAAGNVLVNFSLIDSSQVQKKYVAYNEKFKSFSVTDKSSALKWGTEERAGKYFAEHAASIQSAAANYRLDYVGTRLAHYVQLFLVGDKYGKLQYTAVGKKVQASYPAETALSNEAAQLYTAWLQDINSGKLNPQLTALSARFAALNIEGKSTDYKYFVYTNAALLAAMGQDLAKAHEYGVLADKNDPNAWKPSVSNTIYGVYRMYQLRKLLAERSAPDAFIDLAGGAANVYNQ